MSDPAAAHHGEGHGSGDEHGHHPDYVKIWAIFFLFAMVKAIVPRYRYDQLMRLGWKIFLPTSLAAVAAVGAYQVYFGPASGGAAP